MKRKLIFVISLIAILAAVPFTGCAGGEERPAAEKTAVVDRGDMMVTVTADGQLKMPHEAKLRFGAPGTVKEIYVEEGNEVKEGTLLVKLDDTAQKLALAAAQYDVELVANEIVERTHPALLGYPEYYPDGISILYVEEAKKELKCTQKMLGLGDYQEAMSELRLAQLDIESAHTILDDPTLKPYLQHENPYCSQKQVQNGDAGCIIEDYPQIIDAIEILEDEMDRLGEVQRLIEQGNYEEAIAALQQTQNSMQEVYNKVASISGRIPTKMQVSQKWLYPPAQ